MNDVKSGPFFLIILVKVHCTGEDDRMILYSGVYQPTYALCHT
jgi:hypothetical protein